MLKCQNHSGTDQNTLLLFEGNSVLGYMKPLDQVLSIIEIRVDSFLILHMAATGSNDCWQVIQVDQGAGPVTLAVDNHGRILQAPGVPMQALYGQTLKDGPTIIDTGASHNVIGTNAARKVLEKDQRSRASKLSRRRQSLAMGLKGKKDEQAETISDSGTDITWWKDRVGPQGDPQLPVLETMPKNVKQCHMSVDDDNVTVDYADCCQVPTGQFATACPTTSGPPRSWNRRGLRKRSNRRPGL